MLRRSFSKLAIRVLPDGTKLDGTFEGERLLQGTATLPDGRIYTGTFDATHGFPLSDTVLQEDGDYYQGAYNAEWQRHGEGAALLADGTRYAGQFEKDELVYGVVKIPTDGGEITFIGSLRDEQFVKGKLEHPDYTYEGEFEAQQPHGKGALLFTSGATQDGTFFRGKLHGRDCKMRLESGHVYQGSFCEGRITEGVLKTPTFTYEGHFNEQGMAEGEGRAEYLTMHPRVIFTGLWVMGHMKQGSCVDEFGTPLDYANDPDLRAQFATKEDLTVDAVCRTSMQEKTARFHDMNDCYVRDAARVSSATGRSPSKFDIGYEPSVEEDCNARFREQERAAEYNKDLTARKQNIAQQLDLGGEALKHSLQESGIDIPKAKQGMLEQYGYQEAVRRNAREQLGRFLETAVSEGGPKESTAGLEIKGNAPWKSWTRDAGKTEASSSS